MVLKKKMALMTTTVAITIMTMVGCGNSGSSSGGTNGDPYKVLANKNARAAISMAIDKKTMCDTIINNGTIPADYIVAESLAFNEQGKDYREVAGEMGYHYNKEEATKLWEKAKKEVGFDTVTLELLSFDSETGKRQAEFMQAELQTALPGLKVEVKSQPFKQKIALEEKGDFHLSHSGWSPDYPDPLTFLETMQTGVKYAANTGYSNPEYDKLIEEAKTASSQEESWEKFAKAEKIMLEDGFLSPLIQSGASYLQKPYVSGRLTPAFGVPYI